MNQVVHLQLHKIDHLSMSALSVIPCWLAAIIFVVFAAKYGLRRARPITRSVYFATHVALIGEVQGSGRPA